METTRQIDIKSADGKSTLLTTTFEGSKGYYSLMQHDYITLSLKLRTPIDFKIGSYVDLRGVFDEALGGKLAKMYYVTEKQDPTYNTSTGAYEYQLRLNAYYWLWNNFIFKYAPESTAGEASWSLTAPLDVQLGVFLRNLSELGFTYNGTPYEYSIDSTVENKAVAMTYSNTRLLDALFSMGGENAWNCDVWVTENVIHFGRCEHGDAVKIEIGVEASNMTRNESKGTYATRIYAFGSTRNIPANYRETSNPDLTVNGIVQKRLMLPEDTPYIDAYDDMQPFEVVECVMVNEAIYPRRTGTLSSVTAVDRAIEDGEGNQTGTFKAYQYKDTGLTFDKSYIIEGEELRIVFQSGKLNGLDFGVTFNPNNSDPAEQLWEIVANEDYGRRLPDEVMKPENGDTYILYGFNIKLVSDQYIPQAQEELKAWAQQKAARMKIDDGTYTVPLRASYVKADQINRTYDVGQKVNLVNPAFFWTTGRVSRVIGWEMSLDIPYDNPIYTIGESAQYSRLSEIEDKVDSIVFNGQTYYGTGGGSGVYVIRTNDSTPASDSNVFSALRSLATFLRKDKYDTAKGLIAFLKGIQTGTYKGGVSGAKIDANGSAEFLDLTLRGLQTIGKYVSGVSGGRMTASGWSELEALLLRQGIQTVDFATGALGAGFCLKKDGNGDTYLEVDRMLVRKVATFVQLMIQEMKHVGGQIVLTPASMKCSQVTEFTQYYRCFFENTDGDRTLQNLFVAGDQARCQTFNIGTGTSTNASNRYYWRLVLSVGDDYIDLSKSDCDAGSMAPQEGDEIVQLGNRTDATRQTAIVLSAFGDDAPYFKMYRGINSYVLSGKEFVNISRSSVDITADSLKFSTGENVKTEITSAKQTASSAQQTAQQAQQAVQAAVQAAEEAQAAADEAKEEAQSATAELGMLSSDGYISPVEKTALKQQHADIVAEYNEIIADAAKYGVGATAYTTAYNNANAALDKYTAATPEYIPVESDYAHIAAYYDARQTVLDAISSAAKQYVDTQITESSTIIQETVQEAVLQVVDNKITQSVHTEVTTVVSEMEIGGRNLVRGTGNADGWSGYTEFDPDSHCFTRTTTSGTETYIYSPYFTLEAGRSITLSFESRQVNGEQLKRTPDLYILPDNYPTEGFVIAGYTYTASEDWTRVSVTHTVPDGIVSPVRIRFDHNGSKDGSSVSIMVRNVKLEYGTKATDWTPAPEDFETLAEQAQSTAEEAVQAAGEAAQAAAEAAEEALAAQDRLDSWAEDGVISPTEKQALKDEIARIDADKNEITDGYTRYGLGTPTAFNTAYTAYRSQLVTLSASTPEVIDIPSDFATKQTAYYTARTAALDAIAAAAKTYIDQKETSITQTVTDSILQVLPDEISASVKTEVTTIIGGADIAYRNLVKEGDYGIAGSVNYLLVDVYSYEDLVPGEKYTIVLSGSLGSGKEFALYEVNGMQVQGFITNREGRIYSLTFSFTYYLAENRRDLLRIYAMPSTVTAACDVDWVCLYKGEPVTIPGYFIPAWEDEDAKITTVREWMEGELSVMDDKIQSTVTEITEVNDKLGGYVTTEKHQSDITQLSDSITSKVTSTEVQQMLNGYVTSSTFTTQVQQLTDSISLKVSSSEMNDYKTDWLADADEEAAVKILLDRKFVPDPNFDTSYTSRLYSGITRVAASSAPSGCPTSYCGRISGRDTYAMSYFPIADGEVYHASWYANASQANYDCYIGLHLKKEDGTQTWIITGGLTAGQSGWNRKEGYLNIPDGYIKARMFIQMDGRSNFGYLYVTNLIITDGRENIVRTEMESEIELLNNQISLRVTQTEFDALGNRVSDAESLIEQTAESISMKVWTQDIYNAIEDLTGTGYNLCPSSESSWELGSFSSTASVGSTYAQCKAGQDSTTRLRTKNLISTNEATTIACRINGDTNYDYCLSQFDTDQRYLGSSTFFTWNKQQIISLNSSCRYIAVSVRESNNSSISVSEIEDVKLKIEAGDEYTPWNESVDAITSALLATGIDVDAKTVTVTASSFRVQNNLGTPIAVFKNVGGTPVLQAPYIDVDNLTVKHLEGAEGTFDEIYSTGAAQTYGSESEMRLTNRELAFTLDNASGNIISELHLGGITSQGSNAVLDVNVNNNNMDYNVISGIRIDVAGGAIENPTYNARTMGNHALLIEHGDICGFRLFTRNLTSGGTFTVDTLTSNIRCFNTVSLNIQLPTTQSSWDDGHMLFIRRCASGAITLKGNLRTRWTQDAISSSLSISDAEMWVLQYHKNGNYWFVNYMPNF